MLDVEQGCFTGLDLKNFANARSSSTDKKKHVREIAKKIGIVPKERVCGWSPGGKNAHSVPTLILKGTADAIVAGCQAEDWYNDGLKGERVLLEFPGVGHDMSIGNQRIGSAPLDQTQSFADVIEQFIVMAQTQQQSQFVSKVKPKLEFLKAEEKKPGPSCNPLQPID